MQDELVNHSTDGAFAGGNEGDRALLSELLGVPGMQALLPPFIKRYRDLSSFWEFIKQEFRHSAERRKFI